ncbi:MAG: hypothetical protein CSA65_00475 [Proteobacteria bacterium]|nr:MAG: hypothetical protein CSB49_00035 [Pseudomonadota bacterium]PIE19952.1 MAG: hypothetical protein CSA65_00475 [Pseudomonadota bacterium]
MSTLVFSSEEALRVAISADLVPREVQAEPAKLRRDDGGQLTVQTRSRLAKGALDDLRSAGVAVKRKGLGRGDDVREVSCWAEIVLPSWVGDGEITCAEALFALPDDCSLLGLAGELLRLGCDRQALCLETGDARTPRLLRAVAPPYYTLLRALDDPNGARVYTSSPPRLERVFVQVGYEHPLADKLEAQGDGLLLIDGDGAFRPLPPVRWRDVYQLLDVQLPAAAALSEAELPSTRLPVELTLLRQARDAAPRFWVLRRGAMALVEQLVSQLPEADLAQLAFAVVEADENGEGPTIVLRAGRGRREPTHLELPESVEAYAPYREIAQLLLPADALLEPPLRRQTLEALLAPDPELLTILRGGADDPRRFTIERLPEAALSPLPEWIDYVIDSGAETLKGWARSALFDFSAYESVGVEWAEAPPEPEVEEPVEQKPRGGRQRVERPVTEVERGEKVTIEEVAIEEVAIEMEELLPAVAPALRSAEQRRLGELEGQFLELDAPADAPERLALWVELGKQNARLSREREAALCWTRALWEVEGEQARGLAVTWADVAARLASVTDPLTTLDLDEPSVEGLRAVVASVVAAELAGEPPSPKDAQRVALFFDLHEEQLDVRSIWLSRLALSRLSGGDALTLTRARDRILGRLYGGLSLERDVPSFLRFTGGEGGRDAASVEILAGQLEALLERYGKTRRKPSAVEATEALTRAYVQLSFAWGFARLGQADRARQLRDASLPLVDADDPIHGYLSDAYSARVDQALEGLPAETPLSRELSGRLNDLPRFPRYKIDRLRQASSILEPQERLNPVLAFQRDEADPRGEEFAALRGMSDATELTEQVAAIMAKALAAETELDDRARLFDGVMDFFPMLPESVAVPQLRRLVDSLSEVPPPRRYQLYEEALMLAGLFGRRELSLELLTAIEALVTDLSTESAAELGATVGECLRALRRVGLREEASRLLQVIDKAVVGDTPEALICRVQLGAGLADLGQYEQAEQAFKAGQAALKKGGLMPVERLNVTRALATAYAHMPLERAISDLAKLADQLGEITDSFNTNSHFCLSVVSFMESLILGLASDELALGELGRRWQDEDEYLVRRRVHREAP